MSRGPLAAVAAAVMLLAACGDDISPGGVDASPPPRPVGPYIQPVEDGTYDAMWMVGSAGPWLDCSQLVLEDGGRRLTWEGTGDRCQDRLSGTLHDAYCACYPSPIAGARDWCLCPNVHSLHADLRSTDGTVMAHLVATPL